jgi:hypothetical protein
VTKSEISEFDYRGAVRRIERTMLILAAAGVLGLALAGRMPASAGFFTGSAIAILNFRWLRKGVGSIGDTTKPPKKRSAVLLGLRYALVGAALYVMMKFFGISLMAALAGLLIPVAAAFVEILYELIYART